MKRAFTLVELVVLLVIAMILVVILYPVFTRREPDRSGFYCMSNLKNIGLGFQQYLQDYNEKFPTLKSDNSTFGWVGALQPYLRSTQTFQCPSENSGWSHAPQPGSADYTDYWMNARLAGRYQRELTAPALTIVNGDGNDGTGLTDARYAIIGIPPAWVRNTGSPLYRHKGGANFGFTDGHVGWLSTGVTEGMNSGASPKNRNPTFALK